MAGKVRLRHRPWLEALFVELRQYFTDFYNLKCWYLKICTLVNFGLEEIYIYPLIKKLVSVQTVVETPVGLLESTDTVSRPITVQDFELDLA